MRVVPLALAGLVALAALPVLAHADAPVSCRMAADPVGDATYVQAEDGTGGLPNDPDLDITSADVASNRTHLEVVIRLSQLADRDALSPAGVMYSATIRVGTRDYWLRAVHDNAGTGFYGLDQTARQPLTSTDVSEDINLAGMTGAVDLAKREVRMVVPLASLRSHGPGAEGSVTRLEVTAARQLGAVQGGAYLSADLATSRARYRLGAPSCVRVHPEEPGFVWPV